MRVTFLNNNAIFSKQAFLKKDYKDKNKTKSPETSNCDFQYFNAIKNYNIAFLGKEPKKSNLEEAIYAIDAKGNYKKYENIDEASKELKITANKISKCANGESELTEGFIFAYASNIEDKKQGKNVPDEFMIQISADILDELQDPTKPFLTLDEFLDKKDSGQNSKITRVCNIPEEDLSELKGWYLNNPFYVMDTKGGYRKFYGKEHIAKALGVVPKRINRCINGNSTIEGFGFIRADEIEIKGTRGSKHSLDLEKLQNRVKKKEGFYSIDKNGNYQKFETPRQASEALNLSYNSILNCCSGEQDISNGYMFARAKDLEIKNPDGTISIDVGKINKRRMALQKEAVYLINEKGYERYNSHIEAGEKLGISPAQILQGASGYSKRVHGYVVVNANEVEKFTKDGKCFVNNTKLKQIWTNSKKLERTEISERGFYAIKRNGEYQKFYKLQDATETLGIQNTLISKCLKGKSYIAGDYVYARAEEIEIEKEDGTIEIDPCKLTQKARSFDWKAFYAIDRKGNCTRFTNQDEAEATLGISRSSIAECLGKRSYVAKDHYFVWANEFEIIDKNGEVSLNQDMINEAFREIIKLEFYAIDKDGNYQRFSSRTDAVNKLNIDRSALCGCLKGRYKKAKEYAFINAAEVETLEKDGSVTVDKEKIKEKAKILQ